MHPTLSGREPLARGAAATIWPLTVDHLPALHHLLCDPRSNALWRSRGAPLNPQQLHGLLTREVLMAGVATEDEDPSSRVIGLCELLDPDFVDRRAQLGLIVAPDLLGSGIGIDVALTFAEFAFDAYNLNKLCLEVRGDNTRLVPGLKRLLHHEGTLRQQLNIHGTWQDLELFAIFADDLDVLKARLGRRSHAT